MRITAMVGLYFFIMALAGCKNERAGKQAEPERPTAKLDRSAVDVVQARIGGAPDAPQVGLEFTITGVSENQKPTDAAPFHADGGDWTFFDALVGEAQFSFGYDAQPLEGVPFERATARLSVADSASAAKLVSALAGAFQAPAPAVPNAGTKPRSPLEMSGVVLGRGLGANPDGSYSGTGNWVTCKWTIERDDDAAEFFFSFDLTNKRGVFSEKDADYRESLLNWLSASL